MIDRYRAADDPLCYPGTQVLRNKARITDQKTLDQFEQLMFLSRASEPLPIGQLDYVDYKAIHGHFFQDVYNWAGSIREIRTSKGGNLFCYPENIDTQMNRLFTELVIEHHLTRVDSIAVFAQRASYYLSEINAIHPFREGNGRCQLTLLAILADLSEIHFDESLLDAEKFLSAMITSFGGEIGPLTEAITVVLKKTPR